MRSPSTELVEKDNIKFWVEVTDRISYRKVGHAFRSNSRRLTAEKNAEIAIAEEAARTGKSYEEVVEKSKEEGQSKSANSVATSDASSDGSALPVASALSAAATASVFHASPTPSTQSKSSSVVQLMQLEARRRALQEEEQRLFQLRMEASMRTRAPTSLGMFGHQPLMGMGVPTYGARIDEPFKTEAQLRLQSQLNPTLLHRRAILASELSNPFLTGRSLPLASHLGATYSLDAIWSRGSLAASSPSAGATLQIGAPSFGASGADKLSLGASRGIPVYEGGKLVDALIKRSATSSRTFLGAPSKMVKPSKDKWTP